MARGTPHISLRLDPARRAQLEALAQDRGIDRSAIVRAAVDRYLAAGAPGLGLQLELEEVPAA